jgi:hypothetical protein
MKRQKFRYKGSEYAIRKALRLIDNETFEPTEKTLNISDWATEVLQLSRVYNKIIGNPYITINLRYLKKISINDSKGIAIYKEDELVIIDGNHRLAKRYLHGIDTMDFYILSDDQAKEITIQR